MPHDASSGSVSQVADVNSSDGSKSYGLVVFNNELYFTAEDGDNFELYRTPFPVLVELAPFEGTQAGESEVRPTWKTASEQNNIGFRIQHRRANGTEAWSEIGFVNGHGTTSDPKSYRFRIDKLSAGIYRFRLKQGGAPEKLDQEADDLSTGVECHVDEACRSGFHSRAFFSIVFMTTNCVRVPATNVFFLAFPQSTNWSQRRSNFPIAPCSRKGRHVRSGFFS